MTNFITRPRIVRQHSGAETLIVGDLLKLRAAHAATVEWLREIGVEPDQITLDPITLSADRMRFEYTRYKLDDQGRRYARLDCEPWKVQSEVSLAKPAPPWPAALLEVCESPMSQVSDGN